jgi:hypothetical protein
VVVAGKTGVLPFTEKLPEKELMLTAVALAVLQLNVLLWPTVIEVGFTLKLIVGAGVGGGGAGVLLAPPPPPPQDRATPRARKTVRAL